MIALRRLFQRLSLMLTLVASGYPALAQQPSGWGAQVDGLTIFQGSADLSGGGAFTASREFLRAGGVYRFDNGVSAGLFGSVGRFRYDFDFAGNQPWEDINDLRISVPVRFGLGSNTSALLSPQVRWDYQSGADSDDGVTYGVFAGIAWEVNESLTIGPAFGVFSQIEESDADIFPALLLDWEINDRWTLSTGPTIGATQGPGLSLGFDFSPSSTLSLSARSEKVRFSLNDSGLAPDGVGEDKSVPVVLSYRYNPNPGLSLSVFAGAEFDGTLTLDDANGTEVSRQRYDTAPIAGLALRLRF
jgi:hypothetical protein